MILFNKSAIFLRVLLFLSLSTFRLSSSTHTHTHMYKHTHTNTAVVVELARRLIPIINHERRAFGTDRYKSSARGGPHYPSYTSDAVTVTNDHVGV